MTIEIAVFNFIIILLAWAYYNYQVQSTKPPRRHDADATQHTQEPPHTPVDSPQRPDDDCGIGFPRQCFRSSRSPALAANHG